MKTNRIEGRFMPLRGKDPSQTCGEQTAIIFETLFWTPGGHQRKTPPHPALGATWLDLSAISGSLYLNKAQADTEHHSLSEEQILWKVMKPSVKPKRWNLVLKVMTNTGIILEIQWRRGQGSSRRFSALTGLQGSARGFTPEKSQSLARLPQSV